MIGEGAAGGAQGARLRHPCLSEEAEGKYGRIHLPVSPICNIQCGFCTRKLHPSEEAPGVSRRVLTPHEAAERVDRAVRRSPEITVAGIAGPGDPLASEHAERAFALIHERHPDLVLCLSTNGLELASRVERLWDLGVRSITVTVNAVHPETIARIVPRVAVEGRVVTGLEAAKLLLSRQLEGIAGAARLGAFVKINFVLIPGVNSDEIGAVAQTTARLGAERINIIPLLPQGAFAAHPTPRCGDLERARAAAEPHLRVFRHCQRCRADACGIPGRTDLSTLLGELTEPAATFSHG